MCGYFDAAYLGYEAAEGIDWIWEHRIEDLANSDFDGCMSTPSPHSIEERRQKEQARLDSLKTASERNKWGQFATPPELALSIARYAHALMGKAHVQRFLDPAIGTGSFYSAALEAFGDRAHARRDRH